MIPTLEEILAEVRDGRLSVLKAMDRIYEMFEDRSRREALAATAMQGLTCNALYPEGEIETRCARLANLAVIQADALIAALDSKTPH